MKWIDAPESPETNTLEEVTKDRAEDKELIVDLMHENRELRRLVTYLEDEDLVERLIPPVKESLESPVALAMIAREIQVGNASSIARLVAFWINRAGLGTREWE